MRAPAARRDAEVARMLGEIDARNIERNIRKLVSFGTRNTLSRQDDPARGIGAARDWIYGELQGYSRESGGRLKVELQGFDQEPGKFPRIAKTTRLTNVVATLPGAQGESAASTSSAATTTRCVRARPTPSATRRARTTTRRARRSSWSWRA
jgi:hypothetical protein